MSIETILSRLDLAHSEFNRVADETLKLLADQARASEARQERMTEAFDACHRALDEVLAKLKAEGVAT